MAEASSQSTATGDPPSGDALRMQTLLLAFRQVGMPLLHALTETPAGENQPPAIPKTGQLGSLIDSAVALAHEMAAGMGASDDQIDAWIRWSLAGAASQLVASNFRATGQPLSADDAKRLAAIVGELQEKFTSQIPVGNEPIPNTVATFRAKMMETLVSVVGAVAQYSFVALSMLCSRKFRKGW